MFRALIAAAVVCAAVAASAPHLQAAPTVSPPAPAFISKIAAFHPKTVQCRVTATFYEAGGGIVVEMRLWARPPALWRLDVTAVTPDAPPQNQVVGMRMVFADDRVQVYDPTTGRIHVERVGPGIASRPSASGRLGFTLAELLFVDDPTNYELLRMEPQVVDGRPLVRYDFLLRRPQLVDRVLVARESIWVDGRTSEPVRAQLYDPGGRAVGIIVLRDHRRFDRGIALPMTLELFLDPQSGRSATTRVAFQVKDGRFYLPLRVDAYEGTIPVMSLTYSECEVNRPIDPRRFQL